MEKKVRFKLRKVKKRWVTVSVASAVVTLTSLSGSLVKADSTDDRQQAVTESQASLVTTSEAAKETLTATDTSTATSATSQPTATVTDNVSTTNQSTNTTANTANFDVKPTTSEQSKTDNSDKIIATSKAVNRLTATGKFVPANNNTAHPRTVTDKIVPIKPKIGKLKQPSSLSQDDIAALGNVKNIRKVNGKYYYYKEDGTLQKNYALNINGKTFFFDETGALSNNTLPSKKGNITNNDNTNSFAQYNQVYSTDAANFEHVDHYLTAESWYRPKYILKDGKTWTQSTEKDFRPLLMTWWPDQETQRQYVNYMNAQLGIHQTYNTATSPLQLNLAAQTIQTKIEEKITAEKNTNWLRQTISAFVKTQSAWNSDSEKPFDDHLQKGALLYSNNSKLTSQANSNYRILNRTPTNQTGKKDPRYTADRTIGGYEFLLANDVDNSNPVVQAEQLNWLHFLMNFGNIYANDPDANFDSIRVDAVDNVDADLLQIAGDYLKAAKGIHKNDKAANDHLSILEAWSYNDTPYLHDDGDNMINMDNRLRLSLLYSLAKPLNQRSGMNPLITNSLVNRTDDNAETAAVPSYSFIRAHDSEVQDLIRDIIRAEINPNVVGYSFTMEEIKKAFEIYNKDLLATEKKYTHYNTALSYALLLTNKSSVPRVYYGDMFTDDGQYMAHKTINYEAIETLLKARIKYVSGGQAMRNQQVGNSEIITSVRYGKGALKATDTGDRTTRTSGVAVIEGNNPSLRLKASDRVVVNMGAAHKNQAYRPLLLTTDNGIKAYHSDQEAAGLVRYTNDRGELIFTAADIKGYANPQVSGYLGVWVPVGAAADQDVRVVASTAPSTDGKSVHQNAALDSRVMFEGFSNFQAFATKKEEYTNVVIAKNVDKFAEWGVTDFEMAPQYVSSTDGSFLDSVIQNGYAFTDRYDLGISKPNKYGTADDLVKAIKALHSKGIKVMADWVPDQMYAFPEKEVVTATRVDKYGTPVAGSQIKNTLYVVDGKSSGKDQQAKYGGAFLEELQAKYPELFARKQISTGVPMDPSVKIKQWSAKYFNGTNILGRGAGYVLKDQATNTYFSLVSDNTFLPKSLVNPNHGTSSSVTGLVFDGKGYVYYSTSGYQAKNTFISLGNNWYYFDNNGYMVTGAQSINGANYYFLSNGIQLRNAIYDNGNKVLSYYGNDGRRYENGYYLFGQQWRYFQNGIMAVGLTRVHGAVQYFDASGFQAKGQFITTADGKLRYFDRDSGNQISNRFVRNSKGEWFLFDHNGVAVTGTVTFNGQRLYFKPNGVQAKGEFIRDADGHLRYYDPNSGNEVRNRFVRNSKGEWFLFDHNGIAVTGARVVNGQRLYFKSNGVQAKGELITERKGRIKYYDPNSGNEVRNRYVRTSSGNWYYFGNDGYALIGWHVVKGRCVYFDENGIYRYASHDQRNHWDYDYRRDFGRGSSSAVRFRHPRNGFFDNFFRF